MSLIIEGFSQPKLKIKQNLGNFHISKIFQKLKQTGILQKQIKIERINQQQIKGVITFSQKFIQIVIIFSISIRKRIFLLKGFSGKNNSIVKSLSNEIVLSILPTLVKINKLKLNECYFVFVRGNNGIYCKKRYQISEQFFNKTQNIISLLCSQIKGFYCIISKYLPYLLDVIGLIPDDFFRQVSLSKPFNKYIFQKDIKISQIKQLSASLMNLSFSKKFDEFYQTRLYHQELQQQVLQNQHYQQENITNLLQLYQFNLKQAIQKVYHIKKSFTIQQQTNFSKLLVMPTPKQLKNKGENKYIFNYIKIINPQAIKSHKFKQGGFSYIKLAKIKFQYVASIQMYSFVAKQQYHALQKWMCIKIPKQAKNQYRLQHQSNIIKLLKDSHCAYFFKYYISNQSKFQHASRLMCDAYNSFSFGQYLQNNKMITPFQTKLFLLSQIGQSLRFLKQHQIVHMDLKPNNIIITKQLLVKILDFGEAYHHQICGSNYNPGYTFPYSAPQYFQPSNKIPMFTFKYDIFSLGIIMFKSIFFKQPFQNSRKLMKEYKKKTYLQKLFICPENCYSWGDRRFMNIFLSLIMRCLNQNPLKRPSPTWIVIILRLILRQL